MSDWISVKDRLTCNERRVLIWYKLNYTDIEKSFIGEYDPLEKLFWAEITPPEK